MSTAKSRPFFALSLALFALAIFAVGQTATSSAGQLTSADKSELLDKLKTAIQRDYVSPDVADRLGDDLTQLESTQQYKSVTDKQQFAALLKSTLQADGHDKHLGVEYSASPFSAGEFSTTPSAEELDRQEKVEEEKNSCFQKVERMPGNIGYLDLTCFDDAPFAGPTAVAAMQFLKNTDALIIDLRHNGGGYPSMVDLLCSYLFSGQPVNLNNFYFRKDNRVEQFWTLSYVPGTRMPNEDVYVLTSSRTFSAAEEFTYDLQALKRATVVGETTRGGGHFTEGFVLDPHLVAFIPIAKAVNPTTKTSWDGVGVHPDVSVNEGQALDTAYVMALEKELQQTTESAMKQEINAALADAKKRLHP